MDFLKDAEWINPPQSYKIESNYIEIRTEPKTDLWQRTYYGFRVMNAPMLVVESEKNFTVTAKCIFHYQKQFDQCGLVLYSNENNWFKASIEFENQNFSRIGSVVTNGGHSDWATRDIETMEEIWYRLSRRGPDFLIESSLDGLKYNQMRIFHLTCLGDTSEKMGSANPPEDPVSSVKFGIYTCSPTTSSFVARFEHISIQDSLWESH